MKMWDEAFVGMPLDIWNRQCVAMNVFFRRGGDIPPPFEEPITRDEWNSIKFRVNEARKEADEAQAQALAAAAVERKRQYMRGYMREWRRRNSERLSLR